MGQSRDGRPVFTCQEIEQHLQSALMAATPDVWSRLDLTVPQETGEVRTSDKIRWESLRARAASLGRASRSWGAAAAACICLLVAGGGYYHYNYLQVASSIEIDVNPSLRLSLNRREKVLQVQALNEDGAALMDSSSLKGQPVGPAVSQVVDALVEQGYLGQDGQEHAILVSVSGRDAGKAEQLKAEVSADVETALAEKEVKAVVYDQTVQVTEELEQLAQTYQVSVGKAGFVDQLIGENEALDPADQEVYSQLMGQTMEELTQEIDQKSYQVGPKVTVVRTGPREEPVRMAKEDGAKEEHGPAKDGSHPMEGYDREQGEQEIGDGAVLASGRAEEAVDPERARTESQEQPGEKEGAGASAVSPAVTDGQPGSIEAPTALLDPEGQQSPEDSGTPAAVEETADGQSGEADDPAAVREQLTNGESQEDADGQLGSGEPQEGGDRATADAEDPAVSWGGGEGQPEGKTSASLQESLDGQMEAPLRTASIDGAEGAVSAQSAEQPERHEIDPAPQEDGDGAEAESGPPLIENGPWQEQTAGTAQDGEGIPTVYRHVAKEGPEREEEMEDWPEEEGSDQVSLIIRNTADEWNIFAPGDIQARSEMDRTDQGKGSLREPVYASEFMSSAERCFLQRGPGAFSENVSEEEKKEIIWFGPGFAFLNESTRDFFSQLFKER